jgi:hypothetical protein
MDERKPFLLRVKTVQQSLDSRLLLQHSPVFCALANHGRPELRVICGHLAIFWLRWPEELLEKPKHRLIC